MAEEGTTKDRRRQSPIKWPGGKRWLAGQVAPILRRETRGMYYEPFCGAGSMFLEVGPAGAVLADINDELVNCLCVIKEKPEALLRSIWRWTNTKECYERVRKQRPRKAVTRAARFLYLIRTAWGGVYRLNQHGEFNVPFGNSGRTLCRKEPVMELSKALQVAALHRGDFSTQVDMAGAGDVIYCDPPYVTQRGNGTFVRYNERLFAWRDQERLASGLKRASERGAFIVLSNAWHSEILALYRGWYAAKVERHSAIARDVLSRRKTCEAVIVNRTVDEWECHVRGTRLHLLR